MKDILIPGPNTKIKSKYKTAVNQIFNVWREDLEEERMEVTDWIQARKW